MDKENFLLSLDELLELPAGTLTGEEQLDNLANWDSLAVIGFIAMIDENYAATVSSAKIKAAKTVNDLLKLITPE